MVDDFLHDFGTSVGRIFDNLSYNELEVIIPTLTTNIGRYLQKFAFPSNYGEDNMVKTLIKLFELKIPKSI